MPVDVLVSTVVEDITAGNAPWATPPAGTPRLLPGTTVPVGDAVTSIERAGSWWGDWVDLCLPVAKGWTIVPFSDREALVTGGDRPTLVLHAIHLLIVDDEDGGPRGLGALATLLRDAGLPARLPAEVFLVNAASSLAAAGVVSLGGRSPAPPPDIGPFVGARRSHRHVLVLHGGARRFDSPVISNPAHFDPATQPDEHEVGYIEVTTNGSGRGFTIRTDSDVFTNWCASGGFAPTPPDDAGGADGADGVGLVRVLTLPGDASRCIVIVDGLAIGPFDVADAPDRAVEAIIAATGAAPDESVRTTPLWATTRAEGRRLRLDHFWDGVPDGWSWLPHVWIGEQGDSLWTVDARMVHSRVEESDGRRIELDANCWHADPVSYLESPVATGSEAGTVAVLVDALRHGPGDSAPIIAGAVAAISQAGRLSYAVAASEQPTVPDPVAPFAGIGTIDLLGSSHKLSSRGIEPDRSTWWFRRGGETPPDTVITALVEFGLPEDVARLLGELDDVGNGLVLAADRTGPDENARRKVYLPVVSADVWNHLIAARPALTALIGASPVSSRPSDTGFPLMVAWKFVGGPGRVSTAVYRRHDGSGITVGDAVTRVLAGQSECVDAALALLAHDRDLSDVLRSADVEVIEDNGRSSMDIDIARAVTRGERGAPAAWFAAACGVPELAAVWAGIVARSAVTRFILGTDEHGGPFATVHTA